MTKKIRLKEIAKAVGCSQATVSHAFNDPKLVNRQTRQEILRVSEELGYSRKRYFKQKKKIIGITARSFSAIFGPYYKEVTEAVLAKAKEEGVNVIIESFEENEDSLPTMFAKKMLDGVLVYWDLPQEHILKIKETGLPLVICGYPLPGFEVNTVLSDGRSGMYEIAKHLIELGHKRFGYITGGPVLNPITSDRMDGFRYGLTEAKLRLDDDQVVVADFGNWELAAAAVDQLMAVTNPPTAIICENDALAFVACRRLQEKGYKVPKDVSVTGFDNTPYIPGMDWEKPHLTTVNVDLAELGALATTVLFDLIEEQSRVACRHTLPVKLVIGKTTGRAK
jgi:DNA-binding LacI/PurR family transcriptional regulator